MTDVAPIPPESQKKRGRGRPRIMTGHLARKVFLLAGYGLTDEQVGEVLGISTDTIGKAKKDAEFGGALKQAKELSDLKVLNSLFMLATGHDYVEEELAKVGTKDAPDYEIVELRKHNPPNVMACMYWLNNRRRGEWKTKPEEEDQKRALNIRLFSPVAGQEIQEVRQSGSQVDVLLGADFVESVKAKK